MKCNSVWIGILHNPNSKIKTKSVFVLLIWFLSCAAHDSEADENAMPQPQYCPYFQNRAPMAQPSLKNCTWYKEKACCLDEELDVIFSNLLPMAGADQHCLEALNHLYCYVCSPKQSDFFIHNRLTVCEESCDMIYQLCANAFLKGVRWQKLYTNGSDFCKSRKFHSTKKSAGQCFDFIELLSTNVALHFDISTVLLCSGLYIVYNMIMT